MAKIKTVLEVGTYETRLLTLESANSGEIRLKKCLSVNTPKDYVASTYIELPIMDVVPVKDNIASLVKGAGLSNENIFLLLPDHTSISEMLIAPPRYSKKETEEAIREDLEPIMPLPYDNWHVVYKSLGNFEEDDLIAARNRIILSRLRPRRLISLCPLCFPELSGVTTARPANF